MYRLENGVEWTSDLKSAFKHNVTRAKILWNGPEINENNNLSNLTLDEQRYISNLGFIGSATAKKLEVNLIDMAETINLENEEITLKIGADYNENTYYINYGNFIVDKAPQTDATDGKIRVVAYDYMIKFNKPYVDRVKYPCSMLTLLKDICSQAEVELGSEDFANKNFIVENNQFEGFTLRQVLQEIAKCAFSWARIGQDNKLYLDFSLTADNTEIVTIDDYKVDCFKKANEYYGPVNQVTYADSIIEGQEARVKDQASIDENGLKELVIYDNLFAYTPAKRNELIQAGTRLLGLTYMPNSQLDLIGLAYLDCRDIMQIGTLSGDTYTTRVFNHRIKYTGVLTDSITNEATSDNQEAYKNTATNVFQDQRTRIAMDKANKRIELVVEDVENNRAVKSSSGNGQVTLSNCRASYLIKLRIIGNNQVFSGLYISNRLYVSSSLYLRGDSKIIVTDENGNSIEYDLGITDVLRANSEVYDEYIFENNEAKVIRRVNSDYTTKAVEEIEILEAPEIYLQKGENILKIKGYYANVEALYLEDNGYTDQMATEIETRAAIELAKAEINIEVDEKVAATEIETRAAIELAKAEINIEVNKKVGKDEIIQRINLSEEGIQILASKLGITAQDVINIIAGNSINLTSKHITINSDNFNVDENGNVNANNINATNGTFEGDLYMGANKQLASVSQGIMSTLFATGTGPLEGYEYLGYGFSFQAKFQRTSPMVGIYIPNNFTPVYAYLFIEQVSPSFVLDNQTISGRATATKIRKGSVGPSAQLYGFASEYFMDRNALSGTDITQSAFGSSTITPNVGMTISNNIASQLTKGQLNVLSAYITDGTYDGRTYDTSTEASAARITGLVKLSVQVIGYLNPF